MTKQLYKMTTVSNVEQTQCKKSGVSRFSKEKRKALNKACKEKVSIGCQICDMWNSVTDSELYH